MKRNIDSTTPSLISRKSESKYNSRKIWDCFKHYYGGRESPFHFHLFLRLLFSFYFISLKKQSSKHKQIVKSETEKKIKTKIKSKQNFCCGQLPQLIIGYGILVNIFKYERLSGVLLLTNCFEIFHQHTLTYLVSSNVNIFNIFLHKIFGIAKGPKNVKMTILAWNFFVLPKLLLRVGQTKTNYTWMAPPS